MSNSKRTVILSCGLGLGILLTSFGFSTMVVLLGFALGCWLGYEIERNNNNNKDS